MYDSGQLNGLDLGRANLRRVDFLQLRCAQAPSEDRHRYAVGRERPFACVTLFLGTLNLGATRPQSRERQHHGDFLLCNFICSSDSSTPRPRALRDAQIFRTPLLNRQSIPTRKSALLDHVKWKARKRTPGFVASRQTQLAVNGHWATNADVRTRMYASFESASFHL